MRLKDTPGGRFRSTPATAAASEDSSAPDCGGGGADEEEYGGAALCAAALSGGGGPEVAAAVRGGITAGPSAGPASQECEMVPCWREAAGRSLTMPACGGQTGSAWTGVRERGYMAIR